ncbi:MAG: dockerin type I repeat-containing protein [Ruminococcus sp.]
MTRLTDDDGRFDASDAVTLQNYILGRTGECSVNADMNGDGVLNSFDICLIRKKLISEQVQAEY